MFQNRKGRSKTGKGCLKTGKAVRKQEKDVQKQFSAKTYRTVLKLNGKIKVENVPYTLNFTYTEKNSKLKCMQKVFCIN